MYAYYVKPQSWPCKTRACNQLGAWQKVIRPFDEGDMVLKILYAVGTVLPSEYYTYIAVAVVGIVTVYTFAQGRKTSRERVLHGRTILITAASHFIVVVSLSG